jgi:hypothetical protein
MMTILTALVLLAQPAAAFTEDLCSTDSGLQNCYRNDCTPGDEALRCKVGAFADGAALIGLQARSMLHFDATYYMALEVGFSADDAYLMAAYDEATDLGQYVPTLADAQRAVDPAACDGSAEEPDLCPWVTGTLTGVVRTSLPTGGYALHLSAPFSVSGLLPEVDGKHPDVHDQLTEMTIANVRGWAYQEGPLCVGGFSRGARCPSRGVMRGQVPLLGYTGGIPTRVELGEQLLDHTDGAVLASEAEWALPEGHATMARFGIYLHLLQDRISHSECGDASVFHPVSGGVHLAYSADECDQLNHTLRHAWEIGVDQDLLEPRHRNTEPALEVSYDELVDWARAQGTLTPGADDAASRDATVARLLGLLQTADASARVSAFQALLAAEGYPAPHGF